MISSHSIFGRGLLLAFLFSPFAKATTLQLAAMSGYAEPAAVLPAVFGNREQGVDLDVSNAAPLSGPLMADLFQVSGELSMPLAANVRLQDAVTLTGTSPQRLHVSIKFPDVKQRAQILVRLSVVGVAPPNAPTVLGELSFEVFPASMTKELTDLLRPRPDGSVPVVLFGAGRKLHAFLNSVGVRFDDGGLDLPDRFESDRLYLGESNSAKKLMPTQEMINTAHVALFESDPSLPAGIYSERHASGVFIQVTQQLLDNLAIDPRAQLALIKIIHLLKSQASTNNSPPT